MNQVHMAFGQSKKRRGFTLIELLIVISILVILSVAVAMNFIGFDYDARHSTSKNNLAAARSAVSLYRSRHSAFPKPTESGGTVATRNGANTLEAILTNTGGKGDGTEYIRGGIAGELISMPKGNNFVCIINTIEEFYKDQSDFSNCVGTTGDDQPTGNGGGFLYCPVNGAMRLNFQVQGDDLRTTEQSPIQALAPDWTSWAEQKQDLEKDWPVRW